MSGEPDTTRVEELLRAAGAPPQLPPGLHAAARAAALGERPARLVAGSHPRRPWRPARLAAAVGVLAAAAAASLVIGVGGTARPPAFESTVTLSGAGSTRATMQVGADRGGMRQVVFTVDRLPPAPPGHYYEAWYRSGSEVMVLATFETGFDGHVQLHTTMPGSFGWSRCWVTMESTAGGASRVVLDSAAAA